MKGARHNHAGVLRRSRVTAVTTLLLLVPALCWGESDGAEPYSRACAACHGSDGQGRPQQDVGFAIPLPDFSNCSFASREPDADWYAITHQGGPARAFDRMMPAFGEALDEDDIFATLRHIRTFCANSSWPRGEFNLPRALFTEKAFVEDELVVTTAIATGSGSSAATRLLYERRFRARSMFEVSVPFGYTNPGTSGSGYGGLGDVALGYKYAASHNLRRRSIVSVGGEIILPTGNETEGLGGGTTVLEPFVAYGVLLPRGSFLQVHALAEFKTDGDHDDEAGLRIAIGKTWSKNVHGRSWTPMVEVLTSRDLTAGADANVDVVPELQVSLSKRQHVLLNVGTRIPVNNTSDRGAQVAFYFLWDWFDGGILAGW